MLIFHKTPRYNVANIRNLSELSNMLTIHIRYTSAFLTLHLFQTRTSDCPSSTDKAAPILPINLKTSVRVVRTSASRLAESERTESGRRKSDMRTGWETGLATRTFTPLQGLLMKKGSQGSDGLCHRRLQ